MNHGELEKNPLFPEKVPILFNFMRKKREGRITPGSSHTVGNNPFDERERVILEVIIYKWYYSKYHNTIIP